MINLKTKIVDGMEVTFCDEDAPGVPIKKGSRVRKQKSEKGDTNSDGAFGTILGSIGPIPFDGRDKVYGYFVDWDDNKGLPVHTIDYKVCQVKQ